MHASGVVGLNRFEGEDLRGVRYTRTYYVARVDDRDVACGYVVCDGVDRRARFLRLHSLMADATGSFLREIVASVAREALGDTTASIVVDVRADALELQVTLERLGFWPTIYYPSLIAEKESRLDAIQYTRLLAGDLENSRLPEISWRAAQSVIKAVERGYVGVRCGEASQ